MNDVSFPKSNQWRIVEDRGYIVKCAFFLLVRGKKPWFQEKVEQNESQHTSMQVKGDGVEWGQLSQAD